MAERVGGHRQEGRPHGRPAVAMSLGHLFLVLFALRQHIANIQQFICQNDRHAEEPQHIMTVAVGFVGISLLQHASLNVDVLLSVSGVVGISLLQHASLNVNDLLSL